MPVASAIIFGMKKLSGNSRNLESFRLFPFVAWALIIGFSVFVYGITVNLQAAATDLKIQTEFTANTAKTPIDQIKTFEPPAE